MGLQQADDALIVEGERVEGADAVLRDGDGGTERDEVQRRDAEREAASLAVDVEELVFGDPAVVVDERSKGAVGDDRRDVVGAGDLERVGGVVVGHVGQVDEDAGVGELDDRGLSPIGEAAAVAPAVAGAAGVDERSEGPRKDGRTAEFVVPEVDERHERHAMVGPEAGVRAVVYEEVCAFDRVDHHHLVGGREDRAGLGRRARDGVVIGVRRHERVHIRDLVEDQATGLGGTGRRLLRHRRDQEDAHSGLVGQRHGEEKRQDQRTSRSVWDIAPGGS
jgi:hypothetical protein